jgi:hypothetical protein
VQANFDYSLDKLRAEEAAVQRASQIEARAQQGALNTLAVIGKEWVGPHLPKAASPLLSVPIEMVKGWFGIATLPPPAPESHVAQMKDDLIRQNADYAAMHRDQVLADAAVAAGLFGPGELPDVLVPHDRDGDGDIDGPSEHSPSLDAFGPQTSAAYNRWSADHPVPGGTALGDIASIYSRARESAFTGTSDGPGAPAHSVWRDDGKARELAYGQQAAPAVAPPGSVPDVFGLPPADPRRLDDPRYVRQLDSSAPE